VQSQVWQGQPDLRFQSLGKGATLDLSARLLSTDGSARAIWPKNLRCVVWMLCVSGGWSVHCGPISLNCGSSRIFVICDADTTNQISR